MDDKLLFTEKEWNAAMTGVVKAMTEYLRPYRTPIYKHCDTYGEGWGSGSYLRLGDKVFILTNEHVAAVREQGVVLKPVRRAGGHSPDYRQPCRLSRATRPGIASCEYGGMVRSDKYIEGNRD